MEWYLLLDDRLIGPLTAEEVKHKFDQGLVTGDTYCKTANSRMWIQVSDFGFDTPPSAPANPQASIATKH